MASPIADLKEGENFYSAIARVKSELKAEGSSHKFLQYSEVVITIYAESDIRDLETIFYLKKENKALKDRYEAR